MVLKRLRTWFSRRRGNTPAQDATVHEWRGRKLDPNWLEKHIDQTTSSAGRS